MKQADRPAFLEAVTVLAEVFNRGVSDLLLEAYWSALADLPLQPLQEAVGRILRSEDFFPTPSRWRQVAEQVVRDRAEAERRARWEGGALPQDAGDWDEKREKVKTIIEELAQEMGWKRRSGESNAPRPSSESAQDGL